MDNTDRSRITFCDRDDFNHRPIAEKIITGISKISSMLASTAFGESS